MALVQTCNDDFERKAKMLVNVDYAEERVRKRSRKVSTHDGPAVETEFSSARDKFKVQVFYSILDKLICEMHHRRAAYADVDSKFSFLTAREPELSLQDIRHKASSLVEAYQCDLEEAFVEEIALFLPLFKTETSASQMLQQLINTKLVNSFPNVSVAIRIYLSILGTSCEGERSFSVLKRVKNYLRSTLRQQKLTALSLLCIEHELLRQVDVDDIIAQFATIKSRKVNIA